MAGPTQGFSMLADRLAGRIGERLAEQRPVFGVPPVPTVVFPALHAAVGDVEITVEGCEAIVVAGRFTHGHFADHAAADDKEAGENVDDAVVGFLGRSVTDPIVMRGSHPGGGGWRDRDGAPAVAAPAYLVYVWSGPLGA